MKMRTQDWVLKTERKQVSSAGFHWSTLFFWSWTQWNHLRIIQNNICLWSRSNAIINGHNDSNLGCTISQIIWNEFREILNGTSRSSQYIWLSWSAMTPGSGLRTKKPIQFPWSDEKSPKQWKTHVTLEENRIDWLRTLRTLLKTLPFKLGWETLYVVFEWDILA